MEVAGILSSAHLSSLGLWLWTWSNIETMVCMVLTVVHRGSPCSLARWLAREPLALFGAEVLILSSRDYGLQRDGQVSSHDIN